MTLYGYPPTPELDAIPMLVILDSEFRRVATPDDFGAVWRALELGMEVGELLRQREPHCATVYNVHQLGLIHRQASAREESRRPDPDDLAKFWEYCRPVSLLRGYVFLPEMA